MIKKPKLHHKMMIQLLLLKLKQNLELKQQQNTLEPIAEPVVEPVVETVVEPVVEPVEEPVKLKTRKPRQPMQPNPISEDVTCVDVPVFEDFVLKRMQSMRDAEELNKKEKLQALIDQAFLDFLKLYV